MQKKILVLNDLHVGSSYGLLPPDFLDVEGNYHSQNVGQQFLWDIFTKTISRISPQKIGTIVINGDLIDGMQPKNKAHNLTLHRPEDQREAAVKVLELVRNTFPTAEWHFVQGTPYHELPAEVEQAAFILLGKKYPIRKTLKLRVGKAIVQFHHETSFTSALTKGGSLEKELINQYLAEGMNGWSAAHCEVRAHCHYFCFVGRKDRLAIVCPAWQLQTEYTTKSSPNKNIPDLGCVVLSVDDSLIDHGMCPVSFTEYLYRHPSPEVVDISEEEDSAENVPVTLIDGD
jgi:hypothetical protein